MQRPHILLALAVLLGAASAPAMAQDMRRGPLLRPSANPSAIIARELEFAQVAQEKGQWTAFATFAAPDAVLFVPEMVLAAGWLKGRANPPQAVKWQTTEVWSSCDGSLAVSHGAWQGVGDQGWFTTIWQRQQDGTYRYVLDHGDSLKEPLAIPEMVPGRVADCPPRAARTPDNEAAPETPRKRQRKSQIPTAPFDPLARSGRSHDGTLDWAVTVDPAGGRRLVVSWLKDDARQVAREDRVAPPAPQEGG